MFEALTPHLQSTKLETHHPFYEKELPATSTFAFLRSLFKSIPITYKNKPYFVEEENSSYTQNIAHFQMLIQQYYKSTPTGKLGGFYLYRVAFSQDQIRELIKYWCLHDKELGINGEEAKENQPTKDIPIENKQNKEQILEDTNQMQQINKQMPSIKQSQDNEFITTEVNESTLQEELKKKKQQLSLLLDPQTSQHYQDYIGLAQQISELQDKLRLLKASKLSLPKRKVNLKALFTQYAKHMPARGDSFQNIQKEAQSMNYQKLVHLLKQHDIFPQQTSKQKSLHKLFITHCGHNKQLSLQQFKSFIKCFGTVIYSTLPQDQSYDKVLQKIQSKHLSPVCIKKPLRLKPMQGQFQECIFKQLEERKMLKQEHKAQQMQRHSKKSSKKNKEETIPTIACFQNIEMFRDQSFDLAKHFGIADLEEDIITQMKKRVKDIASQQEKKINTLLNGIIDRSDARLHRIGTKHNKQ